MPQINYRANLSSAVFSMTLAKAGRSVISPGPDQNFDKRVDSPGDSTRAVGIPQAIYMENVLPTPDGFQSIGFKPVLGFAGTDTVISSVERVRLAINSSSQEITDDVDVLDEGDQIETWAKSEDFFYDSRVAYPVGPQALYDLTVSEDAGAYLFASCLYAQGDADWDAPCLMIKNFGVSASTVMTLEADITFEESALAISSGLPDATPEQTFMIGLGVDSAANGIKIYYSSTSNALKLCNYSGTGFTGRVAQFTGTTIAALTNGTVYTLEMTVSQSGANRTVTAELFDGVTSLGTVTGVYVTGYVTGGYVLLSAQRDRDSGGTDPATDGITETYAPQRTWIDNIHVTGDVADSTITVVSGVANIDIAFKAGATYDTTWSHSSAEDWEANPVSSADDLILASTTEFSTATVRGIAYVCLRAAGTTKIFELSFLPSPDEDTLVFTDITTIIGATFSTSFTTDDILGISGSFNYLLLHTATVVFWSSTTTPTDFAASLVSGAGSETPGNLKGDIAFLKEHVAGFYIYTTNNVVFAAYTGNRAYPWKFREIAGSGGFSFNSQVSGDTNSSVHYGLNNARFIQVLAPNEANVQSPEVTDFLERVKRWDIFNYSTNTFSTFSDTPGNPTSLINLAEPRVWFVLDRYILLPYGVVSDQYTYCLVFDSLLNRYGKLKITFNSITTDETNIYFLDYETRARKKLYFDMQYSGTAQEEAFQHQGVLVLGKFQLTRGDFIQLEEVEIESAVTDSPGDFTVHLLPTLDGKTFTAAVELTKRANSNPDIAFYPAHTVGQNVSILCKGAFDLNTVQLVAQNAGTN